MKLKLVLSCCCSVHVAFAADVGTENILPNGIKNVMSISTLMDINNVTTIVFCMIDV